MAGDGHGSDDGRQAGLEPVAAGLGLGVLVVVRGESADPCDLRVIAANEAAGRALVRPAEALVGARVVDLLGSPALCDHIEEVLAGRAVPARGVYLRSADRHLDLWLSPAGEGRASVVLVDAAERKEQERRWFELLDTAMDAIVSVDDAHRIVLFNQAVERIFGVRAEEVMGGTLDRFIPERSRAKHEAGMEAFARRGAHSERVGKTRPLRARRADGTEFPIEASVSMSDGVGTGRLFTAILRDVSERERIESQLANARRFESIGVLAGGIAHDFNNILTAIRGHVELAASAAEPGSEVARELTSAREATAKAAELARGLLVYAGRALGEPREAVAVEEVVGEVLLQARASVPDRVRLTSSLPAGLPPIHGARTELRQILANLVLNGAEAIRDAGTVTIGARVEERPPEPGELVVAAPGEGPWVELRVSDDGVGMGPEVVARMFEPFFTTRFHGRGLGLAAVLGLVKAARGGIGVSSAEGVGTVVRVLLPVSQAVRASAEAPKKVAGGWRGKGKLLLVDDEPNVRKVTRRMLELLGFEVIEAESGEVACEVARGMIDLRGALIDRTMPGIDGIETLARLKAMHPGLVCLIMSGFATEPLTAEASEAAAGFLPKPFGLAPLKAMLEATLP